jgi:hypothetical protein
MQKIPADAACRPAPASVFSHEGMRDLFPLFHSHGRKTPHRTQLVSAEVDADLSFRGRERKGPGRQLFNFVITCSIRGLRQRLRRALRIDFDGFGTSPQDFPIARP